MGRFFPGPVGFSLPVFLESALSACQELLVAVLALLLLDYLLLLLEPGSACYLGM